MPEKNTKKSSVKKTTVRKPTVKATAKKTCPKKVAKPVETSSCVCNRGCECGGHCAEHAHCAGRKGKFFKKFMLFLIIFALGFTSAE